MITTNSLEICLLLLDDYVMTGDVNVLQTYARPILESVLSYYRQRYPNRDANNQTDMFPAQALESWQCPDPQSRYE